jgi:hypothetical protein
MKRIFNFCFVLLILFSLFIGCEKDNTKESSSVIKIEPNDPLLDNVPIIMNPYLTENYLTISIDKEDEKVNRNLFQLGISARELFRDNTFNSQIINNAKLNFNHSVNLLNIEPEGDLKSANEKLAKLKGLAKNIDLSHISNNPLKSGCIEQYVPAIYIPNIEIADNSKQPIISSGLEVDTKLDGLKEYEGYIVAWYYNKEGKLKEILINEETAMSTTNPIFIIDNADNEMTSLSISERTTASNFNPTLKSTQTIFSDWCSNEYQINYRYEGNEHSEFWYTGSHIDEDGFAVYVCYDCGYYTEGAKIADVEKEDIGKLLAHWFLVCSNEVEPFNSNYLFYNTFERDWFRSEKSLGQPSANGTTVYLSGNMQYSGDWYAADPSDVGNHPIDFAYIYNNWAKWYENNKTRLRIWRVD